MQFEWHEEKRKQNQDKHGVDFLYAALIFENLTLTKVDDRQDYGEIRFASLGLIDDEPYVVIHTERDNKIRIISAWKGGQKDYETYKNRFP